MINVLQNWMLRPSPPDLVQSRTGTELLKIGDRRVLVGTAEVPVEAGETNSIASEQVRQAQHRFSMMDEDELLLLGIAGEQQLEQRQLLAAGAESLPALRQRQPGRIVAPSGEAFDRRRRGGGRGARGAEQMVRCQASPTVLPVGDQVPGQSRQFLIGRLLGRGGIDPSRRGVPTRQLQRDDRPRIADHRVAHEVAQLVRVGGLARLPRSCKRREIPSAS